MSDTATLDATDELTDEQIRFTLDGIERDRHIAPSRELASSNQIIVNNAYAILRGIVLPDESPTTALIYRDVAQVLVGIESLYRILGNPDVYLLPVIHAATNRAEKEEIR